MEGEGIFILSDGYDGHGFSIGAVSYLYALKYGLRPYIAFAGLFDIVPKREFILDTFTQQLVLKGEAKGPLVVLDLPPNDRDGVEYYRTLVGIAKYLNTNKVIVIDHHMTPSIKNIMNDFITMTNGVINEEQDVIYMKSEMDGVEVEHYVAVGPLMTLIVKRILGVSDGAPIEYEDALSGNDPILRVGLAGNVCDLDGPGMCWLAKELNTDVEDIVANVKREAQGLDFFSKSFGMGTVGYSQKVNFLNELERSIGYPERIARTLLDKFKEHADEVPYYKLSEIMKRYVEEVHENDDVIAFVVNLNEFTNENPSAKKWVAKTQAQFIVDTEMRTGKRAYVVGYGAYCSRGTCQASVTLSGPAWYHCGGVRWAREIFIEFLKRKGVEPRIWGHPGLAGFTVAQGPTLAALGEEAVEEAKRIAKELARFIVESA